MPLPVVSVVTLAVSAPSAPTEAVIEPLILCTLVKSTSLKLILPESVRFPLAVPSSVTAPVTSVVAMIGV